MNDNDLRPCLVCGVPVRYGRRTPTLSWLYKNAEPSYGWINSDGTPHLHAVREAHETATHQQS